MKRNMLENHPKMEKQKKYCNFSAKMKLSFSKTKLSQSKNRGLFLVPYGMMATFFVIVFSLRFFENNCLWFAETSRKWSLILVSKKQHGKVET
jgi:hypothetical protein